MSDRPHAVVVGGSSGIGRQIAEELAEAGYDLIVSARHGDDLRAVSADLELRYSSAVTPLAVDLRASDSELDEYLRACTERFRSIDAVLFPVGMVADDDDGIADWSLSEDLIDTNFVSVMKLAGRFIERLEADGKGTIVLFSSIAAGAPRMRNVAYAAAKRALESYGRSMQHRLADTNVSVQIYRLGYVDTAMSRGRQLRLPPANPAGVGREVVANLSNDRRRIAYYPRYWRLIVFVLNRLPWSVYKRLTF